MILENMTLQYTNKENGEKLRILYIDHESMYLYYVIMGMTMCMPKKELIDKLEEEIATGVLIKIADPFLNNIDEKDLSENARYKRDQQWEIIKKYWDSDKEAFLEKKGREKLFKEIADKENTSRVSIKRIFNRFWERGMTKNALLPDYKNSGAKGKERNLKSKKVGRPKKVDYIGEVQEGINITEDIKKIINLSIDKFYRKKEKPTIKAAYNSMLKEFFSDRYVENGEIKYNVWSKARIPSYRQFYYWFKNYEDIQKDIIFRGSKKEYELKHRPILGTTAMETDGPGTRFQIDATVADIYIVSSLNRNRIIGRPIVYMVIDVYSRLVTGIYTGLEGPSWMGAMMTLDNMIADKVEFCKEYDIHITKEQWTCKHLPEIIIADRGEFEGYSVENLINNLNIKIENTPPYRGDLKGIVERSFRTVNEKLKHKTPGAIQKEFRERGDRDYRLDATLTLEEFTQILIKMVLHHNHKIITNYNMDKEMISDELTPTPINLWDWGIKNKKGRLRVIDRDIMKLNLLPRGKASISRAGLKFKKLFYSSQKAIEEQWFVKAKQRWVDVVYDPRNMNDIYILHEDGKGYEVCHLLEKSLQYKDCRLEEIIFQEELKEELIEWEKDKQNQLNIDLDKEIEDLVKKANKEKKDTIVETNSKSKKLKGIKENRTLEKEINRKKEAFEIGRDEKEGIVKAFNKEAVEEDEEEKDIRRLTLMEKIKRKRDEKLGKK
ncbi:Mu transposase C-terminal domain-containing protein [Marinisporobacter balticus]|uniref:Mu transposase-like protein n=1 Tax=Marinisporobacter balticus TaxID=2018667 RepID=A0A4V2SAI5_9FIRM|nr:Mu transposase C-terminal domain-containing protein [Marinisporobacter balticus]TCO71810.1 Mu transposase-like protein [Marinisporobacter balticus]